LVVTGATGAGWEDVNAFLPLSTRALVFSMKWIRFWVRKT
jgi:hypothetical protein